jgi:hypothetical protein
VKPKKSFALVIILLMAAYVSGCATSQGPTGSNKYMKQGTGIVTPPAPSETEAAVVFMRPSSLGYAVNSSVYDLSDDDEKMVGIVSAKKKVPYITTPGEHLFMVIGESADFMAANLEPGKTYYALVTPRMGAWKARFSLKPVTKLEMVGKEFKDWDRVCAFEENSEDAVKWAKQNSRSIKAKRAEYFPKWKQKPDAEKPLLKSEDAQ